MNGEPTRLGRRKELVEAVDDGQRNEVATDGSQVGQLKPHFGKYVWSKKWCVCVATPQFEVESAVRRGSVLLVCVMWCGVVWLYQG